MLLFLRSRSGLARIATRINADFYLLLKTAIFGLALFFAAAGSFRPLPILFFIVISGIMYARPFFGSYSTLSGFLILLVSSILGLEITAGSILFFPSILLFSFLFYLILGIKDFLFVKRSRLYFIAMLLLFYAIFAIFFLSGKSELYLLKYGGAILASFLLFREWLALIPSFHFPRREIIASAISALIISQMLWAAALLPIGFISASSFMILLVFILASFLFQHFTGGISRKSLLQHLVFFFFLVLLIFGSSYWTL